MRLYFLALIFFSHSLSAHADFEKTLSSLEVWANACEGHADCERLKREFSDLKSHLKSPCIGEQPLSTHNVNSNFETSLKEALNLRKDFKNWSLKELSNLILCMNNNTQNWKEQCKEAKAPFSASCQTDTQKTIRINLDNTCEKVFVETDILLGQGTFNEARTALEYRAQTPHWVQVVHRMPIPIPIPIENLTSQERAELMKEDEQTIKEYLTQRGRPITKGAMSVQFKKMYDKRRAELLNRRPHDLESLEKETATHKSLPSGQTLVGILAQHGPHETYLPRYDGGDAFGVLFERGATKPFVAEQILRTTGHGIEKLHNAHWVHRDLKWENVFVNSPEDAFKTIAAPGDFGTTIKPKDHPRNEYPVGTGGFMAPEQFEEEIPGETPDAKNENAKRADDFSFAVMIISQLGIADQAVEDFGNCQEKTIPCESRITSLAKKVAASKIGNLPLGKILVKALAIVPEGRPTITEIRQAIDSYTRAQFDTLISPVAQNYSSTPEGQEKLIQEKGYTLVPFEDHETGALKLGIKLEGRKDLIEIKNNPLAEQKAFNDEVRSFLSK